MNTCPSTEMLKQFVAVALSDREADEVIAHLESCSACSKRVETLEKGPAVAGIVAGFRELQGKTFEVRSDVPSRIAQYEILEKIGQGGMGTVYRAVQPHLERDVAIKVVNESRLTDPVTRERFKREIQAVGKLRHPNIVQAHDAGFVGDRPYLVMEFLHGVDLGERIKRYGKLDVETASDCIRQAALGLQHAHEAGIVHRDVKPSNLFLTDDNTVKILDLGLAMLLETEEQPISWRNVDPDMPKTLTGHILGSLDFLSPEQALGLKVESSSDVYSLGCTFHFLLSGKPPLDGERYSSVEEKLAGHIRDDFPRLRVPRKTDAILRKMVAKTPANRFSSTGEVAKILVVHRTFRNGVLALLVAVTAAISALAVARRDDGAEAFFNRGVELYELGDHEGAIRELSEAIRRRPKFVEAYNKRATIHDLLLNNDSAIADFSEAIRLHPENPAFFFGRGVCFGRLLRIEDAIRDFNEAIRLRPDDAYTYLNRSKMFRNSKRIALALDDAESAVRLAPRDAVARSTRGLVRMDSGDLSGAIMDFDESIRLNPSDAFTYNYRGMVYDELSEYEKAIADYDKSIELEPAVAETFNNRGLTFSKIGDRKKALADYEEAVRLNPKLPRAYANRGTLRANMADLEGAMEDYSVALDLDPTMFQVHNDRGLLYAKIGDDEAALRDFDEAIRLGPTLAMIWFNRAMGRYKLSKPLQEILADLDEAVRLDPKLHQAHVGKALILSGTDRLDEAIDAASKALELVPGLPSALLMRGKSYLHNDNPRAAIEDLNGIINRLPSHNPLVRTAYAFRSEAHEKLGDMEKAIADAEKVVELGR